MDNQNMGNTQTQQQTAGQAGSQQEKLFTQEEVNRIVGERLSRSRSTAEPAGYAEREQALNQRELQLDARERLAEAGIPKELLPLVNCGSRENMEKSIALLGTYFKPAGNAAPPSGGYRIISTGTPSGTGSASRKNGDLEVREAMGLKG